MVEETRQPETIGSKKNTPLKESRIHFVAEREMYEERYVLEEMRQIDERDMEKFSVLDNSEITIAI